MMELVMSTTWLNRQKIQANSTKSQLREALGQEDLNAHLGKTILNSVKKKT